MLRRFLTALLFAASASCPAFAACTAPFAPDRTFYWGISPSDGPLEVFCRIQKKAGTYEIGIQFAETGAWRFRKMQFFGEGQEVGPDAFQEFVQSLIPTGPAPAIDPIDKMPFSRVLRNVVQGSATMTPDIIKPTFSLSAPQNSELGRALMLWEHIRIKMRPIRIAEADFALTVTFRPSAGRLMYETINGMPALVVGGWRERLELGDVFHRTCTEAIPLCMGLPEVVPIHFAMEVAQVTLEAEGQDLSSTADQVLRALDGTPGQHMGTEPANFDPIKGVAKREIIELPFHLTIEATATPGRPKTSGIKITYQQDLIQGLSWTERLWKQFNEQVAAMNRAAMLQGAR